MRNAFVGSALVSSFIASSIGQSESSRGRAIRIDHVSGNPNHDVAAYGDHLWSGQSESITCRAIRSQRGSLRRIRINHVPENPNHNVAAYDECVGMHRRHSRSSLKSGEESEATSRNRRLPTRSHRRCHRPHTPAYVHARGTILGSLATVGGMAAVANRLCLQPLQQLGIRSIVPFVPYILLSCTTREARSCVCDVPASNYSCLACSLSAASGYECGLCGNPPA